jgi:hypothetical protein
MIVEKALPEMMEDWIEGFLKFFYGFLHTQWRMMIAPATTAQQLVMPATFAPFEFTLPYTYFAMSFLLNFLLLRTLFKVLHEGHKMMESFLPTLTQTLANPTHMDPLTAFILMILKVIPLFGVVILACFVLSRKLRLMEALRQKTLAVFCYCFGFFWNNLTLCLLALLAFANIWVQYRHTAGAEGLLMALYGLLGLLGLMAVLICYRFIRQMFRVLLNHDIILSQRSPLSPQLWAIGLMTVDIGIGLAVEYGMTLLDVAFLKN